jgi:hypothetical protein
LPLIGGTLTGPLVINSTLNVSGATALGGTLGVTGNATFSSGLAVIGTSAGLFAGLDLVSAPAKTRYISIFTGTTAGTGQRWNIGGNATAESGANAGTDFVIQGRSDTGTNLANYLTITRATGASVFTDAVTARRFSGPSSIVFTNAAANAFCWFNGNISGAATAANLTAFSGLSVANDTVAINGLIAGILSFDNIRAGAAGSRSAVHGQLNILGTPADTGQFYVSMEGYTYANVNANGTALAVSGALDGGAFSAFLDTGGTFYATVFGVEASAGIAAGASADVRIILSIEAQEFEAVRGTSFDAGISFNRGTAGTSPGLGYGIAFGHPTQSWFFASDSVLIGAIPRIKGPPRSLLADRGLDLSKVWFTTAAVVLPGFAIDPTGQVKIVNGAITRTASGLSFDIANRIVTAVAPAAAGTAYAVADLVYETTSGSILRVATVNGSGGITGLTLLVPGSLAAAPGAPLPLYAGTGTLATVTLTTLANTRLSLNPSGGDVLMGAAGSSLGFYGATPAAKQTGVAVTAAGIHAALTTLGLIAP